MSSLIGSNQAGRVAGRVSQPVVAEEADVKRMSLAVTRHLRDNPEDGVLFAIDYYQALLDLGFQLSPEIREHLNKSFFDVGSSSPDLYKRIRDGERSPIDIRVSLKGTPAVAVEGVHDLAVAGLRSDSVPATSNAGFCVLVQLTEDVVNRTIEVAYDNGLIKKDWNDSKQIDWPEYGIDLGIRYELELEQPLIDFDTRVEEGIAVKAGLRGSVEIEVRVADAEKAAERIAKKASTLSTLY